MNRYQITPIHSPLGEELESAAKAKDRERGFPQDGVDWFDSRWVIVARADRVAADEDCLRIESVEQ